jgi:hypothetical protein
LAKTGKVKVDAKRWSSSDLGEQTESNDERLRLRRLTPRQAAKARCRRQISWAERQVYERRKKQSAAAAAAAGENDVAVLDADCASLPRADSSETSFRAKTSSYDGGR